MFGISFTELLLVGLVALLVLGPERLPGAARTAGLWIGRLKRSFNAIKNEVEREIGADEIRRQLHNEHILSLEQEARKILNPQAAQPKPAQPPAAQAPATEAHPPAAAPLPVAASEPHLALEQPAPAPVEPVHAVSDPLPVPPLTSADAASSETVPTPKPQTEKPATETSLPPRAP
nr:Sec-independent protein translocase protein TatB [Pseudomonas baltica]